MALLHGVAPYDIGRLVWKHVLSTPYGLSQILFRATPLIFTGLAVAIAFQTGLFNIGAEGQAVVGSLALATVGCTFSGLPALLLWPLVLGAGLFMGGFWGWIPGWLKARWGTHEVINTIMLNFIALALSNYVISHHLAMPESVRTADVAPSLWLPRLSGLWPATQGSPVNLSFVIAVFLAIAIHFFLKSTRAGFALRAAGRGPRAALWAGVKVNRAIILSMALSGAMASLVGLNTVLGYKHYYEDGMTGGVGFIGIGVALLARNNPIAIIPSALFFGFLSFTGLAINHLVPKEAVDVLTGAILILAILAEAWRRKRNRAVRAFTKRSGETGGGGDK
ncbi:MAG: ABC transporter permease [Candidatus Eisenbacteria bacterium]|uniref:ABC transporter permease n=1 Tax=Eiseniibacteriota bacterium TaxID=2212470 RepID=A0A948W890_UNCEI|nr:ABC transporter permease [Candidatus Eisenbacteria bacterium]MBU1947947.1 ABC transporter permease [Candidatus Eisenbacteria bacterium]MBU2693429.1 ABC transporter permease [Candidatus Eisenbacteria bacterium]